MNIKKKENSLKIQTMSMEVSKLDKHYEINKTTAINKIPFPNNNVNVANLKLLHSTNNKIHNRQLLAEKLINSPNHYISSSKKAQFTPSILKSKDNINCSSAKHSKGKLIYKKISRILLWEFYTKYILHRFSIKQTK